jgi:hypothetical protein
MERVGEPEWRDRAPKRTAVECEVHARLAEFTVVNAGVHAAKEAKPAFTRLAEAFAFEEHHATCSHIEYMRRSGDVQPGTNCGQSLKAAVI